MSCAEIKHSGDEPDLLEASDDEDAAPMLDSHRSLYASPQFDKILTAEEVIREIDEILNETADEYILKPEAPRIETKVKGRNQTSATLARYSSEQLKNLSLVALCELESNYKTTTEILSDRLVSELDLRDQLDFDKELKNQFISQLLAVQKKRRDRKRNLNPASSGACQDANKKGDFLTLAIPYDSHQGQPTSEQLQVYITILQAINEESSRAPRVLVDYILRVLCPT